MSATGVAIAADLLLWARRNRASLPGLPGGVAPLNLEQAYEIQAATARLRGCATAGFKIGLTNVEAQRAAGTTAPIAGRLASADVLQSPARIRLTERHLRVVEAEVVFELGRGLGPNGAPFTEAQVAASIRAAFAGIELCDSRFHNCDDEPLANIVADNSNADLLIVGEPLPFSHPHELANMPVTLARRGQAPVTGNTARVLGNPLKSLTWLVNWLAARGEALRCGQLIASGSSTGITVAANDDLIVASFGSQTRAHVSLELALEDMNNEVTS